MTEFVHRWADCALAELKCCRECVEPSLVPMHSAKVLFMKRVSFKPQVYNNVFVGAVFLVLAVIVPFSNGIASSKLVMAVALFLVGILLIGQSILARLTFTDDAVVVSGILPRTMLYADIAKVEWGKVAYKSGSGAGYVGCIVLSSKRGRRMRLIPVHFIGYEGEQGWAALVLQVIGNHTITTDTKIRKRLESAATRAKPSAIYTAGRRAR
jgi:hypothetical protein